MGGLISLDEASHIMIWPVAPDYYTKHGAIYPKDGWQADQYASLTEPDLFLSFARLGAHGEPSEARVLKWVRKHGLLRRADYEGLHSSFLKRDVQLPVGNELITLKAYELNQAPMSVREFREEAREAHSYLTLLESIRSGDIKSLRSRISIEQIDLLSEQGQQYSMRCMALDGRPIPLVGAPPADATLTDEWVLLDATLCLEHAVESKIKDVRLGFAPNFGHPRPLSTFRPRLVAECPDLYSALYYQFARFIADERSWTNCVVCGLPMSRTRSNRQTCSDACRKEKSRRNKAAREASA